MLTFCTVEIARSFGSVQRSCESGYEIAEGSLVEDRVNRAIGVEIQLKILQALPPLLQNYAEDLNGNLLGEALLICSILQGSKMGVVNNTAAASMLPRTA